MEMRDSMWDSLTNLGVGPAMGITAENVADKYDITREQMDAYSLRSQQRAVAAIDAGRFEEEIIPVTVKSRKSETVYTVDEYPKRNATLEGLQKLKPAKAKELGCPIMAKVVSVATTGVEPELMGIGPISSTKKALEKAGLTVDDIDLFEINEAFSSQCLACQKELGVPDEKLNVNGGGISLGHPVGATGSRIVITLMYELKRRKQRYGVATLCAGGGMGTTVVIEMCE